MSILSHYINLLIRSWGAWMLPLCMLFACTPSRHETPSPQTAETNPYTDSLLQFKIYVEQIRISRFKADTLEEARTLEEAERMARFLNDSASYADLWQEKALFYLPKNPETAKTYFRKALAYMPSGTTASTVQNELYLSRIYLQQEQTDSAFHYINEAIHKNLSEDQTPVLHTQKGYIFASLLKADSATHYVLPSLYRLTLKQRTEAYRRLFEMYGNLRDGKRENAYMRKYILSHDSLSTERKEMVIGKIQDMQEYKLQRERANKAEMETAHHKLIFYRMAVALGLVILVLLLLLHRIRTHKQKLAEELKESQWLRMEESLKRKEAEVALAHEQERLKQQEIDRLHKSVEYYRQLNAITLPSLLRKRNSQGALHLTEDEWDIIQQNTDTCFDRFTTRLKEHYPQLTEEELRFCCLVKMDLPLSLLSEIYHIAKGSISRRKMRLKEKMRIENSSFDEFIAGF